MKNFFLSKTHFFIIAFVALLTFSSCLDSDDETSNYANMAEWCLLQTNSQSALVGFYNDDDVYKTFTEPQYITGAKPDTLYRAVIYYYEEYSDAPTVKYNYFIQASVLDPQPMDSVGVMKTDPIATYVSGDVSNNNRYINITLTVYPCSDSYVQTIGFVKDDKPDEAGETVLTFYHEQFDIASSFTDVVYISIPIEGNFESGETVKMYFNTTNGEITKTITIPDLNKSSTE